MIDDYYNIIYGGIVVILILGLILLLIKKRKSKKTTSQKSPKTVEELYEENEISDTVEPRQEKIIKQIISEKIIKPKKPKKPKSLLDQDFEF
jgi:hypothetical protein